MIYAVVSMEVQDVWLRRGSVGTIGRVPLEPHVKRLL